MRIHGVSFLSVRCIPTDGDGESPEVPDDGPPGAGFRDFASGTAFGSPGAGRMESLQAGVDLVGPYHDGTRTHAD